MLLLSSMKRAGWIKIKQDEEGEILGLEIDSNFKLPEYSSDGNKAESQAEGES